MNNSPSGERYAHNNEFGLFLNPHSFSIYLFIYFFFVKFGVGKTQIQYVDYQIINADK